MEEKQREQKRARTVRSDYLTDLDEVQAWIRQAELKVQDRSIEPVPLKEQLKQVQDELGTITDKLERLTRNGRTIAENTRDETEKQLIESTVHNVTEQLNQVKNWLDERKQVVADTIDAWQRFLALYDAVKAWTEEKKQFLVEPLKLSTLVQARQRLHDYSTAVKSCKQINKNLSDMGKELEGIGQVCNVGDLPEKLLEAEEAKLQVESQLLQRNALLQETSEEWEQCERKMKEVKTWIEKAKQSLESPQNKKKPLRDQHSIREKMLSDISIQKTKISISMTKLQVHFRFGIGDESPIVETVDDLLAELDSLHNNVKEQTTSLETCLAQIDQYQQEIQELRQQIMQVEQQLRTVLSPTYLSTDKEKALQEQQSLQQRMDDSRHRIKTLLDQIYSVDPYYVQSNEARLVNQISYADIAAGRTSPSSRGSSPFRNPRDEAAPTPLAIQVLRPAAQLSRATEVQKSVVEPGRDNTPPRVETRSSIERKGKEDQSMIEESDEQREPEIRAERVRHVSKVDSVDSKARSQYRRAARRDHVQLVRETCERNASTEAENIVEVPRLVEHRREALVLKNTLAPKEERRGRSASPIWMPGSTSYADILRGNRQSSRSPSVEIRNDNRVVAREIKDTGIDSPPVEAVQKEKVEFKVPRLEVAEEMEVQDSSVEQPTSQQIVMEDYQQSAEVVPEVVPEIPSATVQEQSEKVPETQTSWADESMEEYVLMSEKNYENVTRPPQQVPEVYNYIHPPIPELVGFIGSQIAYPVSSYVYMPAGPPQQIALPHYADAQLAFQPEQYVAQPSYIPEPEIYQQSQLQKHPHRQTHQHKFKNPPKSSAVIMQNIEEKCLPSQTPSVADVPTSTQPVAQLVEVSEPEKTVEQEQPEQPAVIATAAETAAIQSKSTVSNESKTFSYAQILSQGLSPKPVNTTSTYSLTTTTLAVKQVKERSKSPANSTASLHETTPPQEAGQIRESSVSKQENKQGGSNWDTTRKREMRKTHQDAPKSKIPEKRARRGPEQGKEKPQKEKIKANVEQKQAVEMKSKDTVEKLVLSRNNEIDIPTEKVDTVQKEKEGSVEKEKEVEVLVQDEKEVQVEKQVDVEKGSQSQEKKKKTKKKKIEKSVDDEIEKALKEIEDMDKQKKRDKSREQAKPKESTQTNVEKSRDESEKKNAKQSEKKKQGKSKMQMVKEESEPTVNQPDVKEQTKVKDEEKNKNDSKILKEKPAKVEVKKSESEKKSEIKTDSISETKRSDVKEEKSQKESASKKKQKGKEQVPTEKDKSIKDNLKPMKVDSDLEVAKKPVPSDDKKINQKVVDVKVEPAKKSENMKQGKKQEDAKAGKFTEVDKAAEIKIESKDKSQMESVERIVDKSEEPPKPKENDKSKKSKKQKQLHDKETSDTQTGKKSTEPKQEKKADQLKEKQVIPETVKSVVKLTANLAPDVKQDEKKEVKVQDNAKPPVDMKDKKMAGKEKKPKGKDLKKEEPKSETEAKVDIEAEQRAVISELERAIESAMEIGETDKSVEIRESIKSDTVVQENIVTKDVVSKVEEKQDESVERKITADEASKKGSKEMPSPKEETKRFIEAEKQAKQKAGKKSKKDGEIGQKSESKSMETSETEEKKINDKPVLEVKPVNGKKVTVEEMNKENLETIAVVPSKEQPEKKKHKKSKSPMKAKEEEHLKSTPSVNEKPKPEEKKETKELTPRLEENNEIVANIEQVSVTQEEKQIITNVKEEVINIQVEENMDANAVPVMNKIEIQPDVEKTLSEVKTIKNVNVATEMKKEENLQATKAPEKIQIAYKEQKEEIAPLNTEKTEKPAKQEPEQTPEPPSAPLKSKKSVKQKEQDVPEITAETAADSKAEAKPSQPSTPKSEKKKKKKEDNKEKTTIEAAQIEQKSDIEAKPMKGTTVTEIPKVRSQKSSEEKERPETSKPETPKDSLKTEPEKSQISELDQPLSRPQDQTEKTPTVKNELRKGDSANISETDSSVEETSSTATSKALIIEKTITTVTTTTSIPGSIEVKPPNVKSVKSVEIFESIPLPKIVGSKPTELITLRPETVEASLTTTYARVSNDSAVGIPLKASLDTVADSEKSSSDYAVYIQSISDDDQPLLFGSVQDRRRGRSGTPLSPKSVGSVKEEMEFSVAEKNEGLEAKVSQDKSSEIEEGRVVSKGDSKVVGKIESDTKIVKSVNLEGVVGKVEKKIVGTTEGISKMVGGSSIIQKEVVAELRQTQLPETESKRTLIEEKTEGVEKVIEVPVKIEDSAAKVLEEAKKIEFTKLEDKETLIEEKATKIGDQIEIIKNSKDSNMKTVGTLNETEKPGMKSKEILKKEKSVDVEKQVEVPAKVGDSKSNTQAVISYYCTDLVKPYYFNYRPYIEAEINFYQNFKVVQILEENVPVSAPQRSDSIDRIVQESVMKKPEEKEEKTENKQSDAEARKTALIQEPVKYPLTAFYELESQWVQSKQVKEENIVPAPLEEIKEQVPKEEKEITTKLNEEIDNNNIVETIKEVTTLIKSTDKVLIDETIIINKETTEEKEGEIKIEKKEKLDNDTVEVPTDILKEDLDTKDKEKEVERIIEENVEEKEKQKKPNTKNKEEPVCEKKSMAEKPKKEKQPKGDKSKPKKEETKTISAPVKEIAIEEQNVAIIQTTEMKPIAEKISAETDKTSATLNVDLKEETKTEKTIAAEEQLVTSQPRTDEEIKPTVESPKVQKAKEETQRHEKQEEIPVETSPVTEQKIIEKEPDYKPIPEKKETPKDSKKNEGIKDPINEEKLDAVETVKLPSQDKLTNGKVSEQSMEDKEAKVENSNVPQSAVKQEKAKSTEKSKKEETKTPTKTGKQKQSKEKPDTKAKSTPEVEPKKQEKQEASAPESKKKREEKSKKKIEPAPALQDTATEISQQEINKEETQQEVKEVTKEEIQPATCTKSWASIVSKKGSTEAIDIPEENLQIAKVTSQEIVTEAVTPENMQQITEILAQEPQSPPVQQKPTKHQRKKEAKQGKAQAETKAASSESESEKEKSKPTTVTEKIDESLELFMTDSNKSYAQVAASNKTTSPQSNQEDVILVKPVPLRPDQNLAEAIEMKDVMLEEAPVIEKAPEKEEEIRKLEEMTVVDEKIKEEIVKDAFKIESTSWVEEIARETLEKEINTKSSSLPPAEDETREKMKDSWAAIVGKHVETPESLSPPSTTEKILQKDQHFEQPEHPQIQIHVEEAPEPVPIEEVVQVDEQGFMEFVNRKELRSRRSRSRSRSARRGETTLRQSSDKSVSPDKKLSEQEKTMGEVGGAEKFGEQKKKDAGNEKGVKDTSKEKSKKEKGKDKSQKEKSKKKMTEDEEIDANKIEEEKQKQPEKKDTLKNKGKSKSKGSDKTQESKKDDAVAVKNAEEQVEKIVKEEEVKEAVQAIKSEIPKSDEAQNTNKVDKKKEQPEDYQKVETKEQTHGTSKKNKKSKKGKSDKEQPILEAECKEVKHMLEVETKSEDKLKSDNKETKEPNISESESKPEPIQEMKTNKLETPEKKKGKSKDKKVDSVPEKLDQTPVANAVPKIVVKGEILREKVEEIKQEKTDKTEKEDPATSEPKFTDEKKISTTAAEPKKGEIEEKCKEEPVLTAQTSTEEKATTAETKRKEENEKVFAEEKSKLSKKERKKQKKKDKSATRASSEETKDQRKNEEIDGLPRPPKEEERKEKSVEKVLTEEAKQKEQIKVKTQEVDKLNASICQVPPEEIKLAPETITKLISNEGKNSEVSKPAEEEKKIPKEKETVAEQKAETSTAEPGKIHEDVKDVKVEELPSSPREKSKRKNKQTKKSKRDEKESAAKSVDVEIPSPKIDKVIEVPSTTPTASEIQDIPKETIQEEEGVKISEEEVKVIAQTKIVEVEERHELEVKKDDDKIENSPTDTIKQGVLPEPKAMVKEETEKIGHQEEGKIEKAPQSLIIAEKVEEEEKVEESPKTEDPSKPLTAAEEIKKEEKSKAKKSKNKQPKEATKKDKKEPDSKPTSTEQLTPEKSSKVQEDKATSPAVKPEDVAKPEEVTANGKTKENTGKADEIQPEIIKELESIIEDPVPQGTVPIEKLLDETESPIPVESVESRLETEEEFEKCISSEPEIETVDILIEPTKPKVQFYIADEILVLSPEKKKPAQPPLILKTLSDLSQSKFLSLDSGFWPDKHPYHEAERYLFENLANYPREQPSDVKRDLNDPDDFDEDPNGGSLNKRGGSGGPLSSYFLGGPHTERLIADLPGGIGSWSDYSTYLSTEDPPSNTDCSMKNETQENLDFTIAPNEPISELSSLHLGDDQSISTFDKLSLESVPASSPHSEEVNLASVSNVEASTSDEKSPKLDNEVVYQVQRLESTYSYSCDSSTIPNIPDHSPVPKEHLGRERGSMQQHPPILETEKETRVAEDEAGKRIRGIKDIIQERLMVLQMSLSNLKGTYLPRDSIDSMLSALMNLISELRKYDQEARHLEEESRKIPNDSEAQKLLTNLAEVQARIGTLLTQAEQGRATLEGARGQQEQRGHDIHAYKKFLDETDAWLKNIVADMREQQPIATNKALQDELSSHAQRVSELESLPEISTLAKVLKNALLEVMSRLQLRQQVSNVFQCSGTFENFTDLRATVS